LLIADPTGEVIAHADKALIIGQEGTVNVTAEPSSVENAIMATGTAEGDVWLSDNKKRQGQAENNTSSGPSREVVEAKADLRRPTGDWKIYSF
jgi:hypothetical protein